MTFTELVAAAAERLNLTSPEALARIGRHVNLHYKRLTSSIGLAAARRTVVQADATEGVRYLIFTGIEKVIHVQDRSTGTIRALDEVTVEEIDALTVGTGQPTQYAIYNMGAGSVTIYLNVVPQSAFTLYAEGLDRADTLSGSQEPAFPESFHDALVEAAISEELRKQEKRELAADAERIYQQRVSDLRMFIAKTAMQDIYQGKRPSTSPGTSGSSGSASIPNGAASYTQTGLITFDRDPAAPFAVPPGSAKVANLDADLLDGLDSTAFLRADTFWLNLQTDFGAVGDGVADDTAEWAAAILEASSTKRPLYVPPGTYLVDDLGVVGDDVTIYGAGIGKSIIRQPAASTTTYWGVIGSRVVIQDLEFYAPTTGIGQHHQIRIGNGNPLVSPNEPSDAVSLTRVKLHGFPEGYGLYIGFDSTNIRLTDVETENYFWALTITNPAGPVIVNGGHFKATGPFGGLEIEPNPGDTCGDVIVMGATFDGDEEGAFAAQIVGLGATLGTVQLIGNHFKNFDAGIMHVEAKALIVTGNAFENVPGAVYSQYTGIVSTSGDYGTVTWEGNTKNGEPTLVHFGGNPIVNNDFRQDPNALGWSTSLSSATVTHETTGGLTGGLHSEDGTAALIEATAGTGTIFQDVGIQAGTLTKIRVTFQLDGSEPDVYPQIRVSYLDDGGVNVTPNGVKGVRLVAPDNAFDTDWHQAILLCEAPADARTARIQIGFFAAATGAVRLDNVEVLGAINLQQDQPDRLIASTTTSNHDDWDPGIRGNTTVLWSGASDIVVTGFAKGKRGHRILFKNTGTAVARFSHNVTSSSANRLINTVTSAGTPVAGGGWIEYEHDGTNWKLLRHEQGAFITSTFAAGDYTASGSLTWTVASGDVVAMRHKLDGNRLTVLVNVGTTTTGGTASNELRIAAAQYGGFTATVQIFVIARVTDAGGTPAAGAMFVDTAGTRINVRKIDSSNFSNAASDNTAAQGTIQFQVT